MNLKTAKLLRKRVGYHPPTHPAVYGVIKYKHKKPWWAAEALKKGVMTEAEYSDTGHVSLMLNPDSPRGQYQLLKKAWKNL